MQREMKIVTYNVNGLRQRISQFGSLAKLLNSFDADIVCFQETKLRRQELTADLVIAEGYESFFSCTRTSDRGRTGYSGVATFCRVKAAFSSNEVALPVAAEEGFSGLVDSSKCGKQGVLRIVDGLEEFEKDELLKVDSEGRCVVTDHGHFVLFNLYGPRAESDDMERVQFKRLFYKILQKRWENLLRQERRVFVVGDLNISPTAMDRCDAGPDFENNEFRRWFRSLLVEAGGLFVDIFRAKHPDRREAFTCWPSNTGAEQFNYGTRIDHILCAGPCMHQELELEGHDLVTCHVKECDILTEYKRWKPGSTLRHRWKGGLGIKLEGSDHAPVYMSFVKIPDIGIHGTPSLSSRYLPMINGVQQTLVSILTKREAATQIQSSKVSSSLFDGDATVRACSDSTNISFDGHSKDSIDEACRNTEVTFLSSRHNDFTLDERTKKKTRKGQAQLSLTSFFQKQSNSRCSSESSSSDAVLSQKDVPSSNHHLTETLVTDDQSSSLEDYKSTPSTATQVEDEVNVGFPEKGKNSVALLEWQRIQQLMQNSIPLCKGHKEPCVARIVKKPGPTFGRRFYVCARAEGPASNPEANCGYFKWAASKSRNK